MCVRVCMCVMDVLTLSLAFLLRGKPDREMESPLSSKGVGSISQ